MLQARAALHIPACTKWAVLVSVLLLLCVAAYDQVEYVFNGAGPSDRGYDSAEVVRSIYALDNERINRINPNGPSERSTISAFYPAMGRDRAMAEALRRFRAAFPTAPIRVNSVTRNGCLLAEAAGARCALVPHAGWFGGTIYRDASALRVWLDGLLDAASAAPWVTILEDDVWWLRPFDLDAELVADLNCALQEPDPSTAHRGVFDRFCPASNSGFCGFGGTVIRSSMLVPVLRDAAVVEEVLTRIFSNKWAQYVGSDVALSILCA